MYAVVLKEGNIPYNAILCAVSMMGTIGLNCKIYLIFSGNSSSE